MKRIKQSHKMHRSSIANILPHRIKKGQVLNPNGAAAVTKEQRILRSYTRQTIGEMLNKMMEMDVVQIEAIANEKGAEYCAFERIIASILVNCYRHGDFSQIDKLLDRTIGKVPLKVESELSGAGGVPLIPATINYIGISATESAPPEASMT